MPDVKRFTDEIGVYIHYPLCRSRCGYCDFAVVVEPEFPEQAYADAVLREIEARRHELDGRLATIYLGGGTPSLWGPAHVARVLAGVRAAAARVWGELEVTLEANPNSVEPRVLDGLRAAGVNRLSFGVQSLDDALLTTLTRDHRSDAAAASIAAARQAGFDNVSADLIFGVPGQSTAHHLEQLRRLLELGPDHVSLYALTLAPQAPLRQAGLRPADDDRMAEMMEQGRGALESAGYRQYEVSNFALPERRSVHNALVWAGRPYLGLGASAHGTVHVGHANRRVVNPGRARYLPFVAGPLGYHAAARTEAIEPAIAAYDMLWLGLRTTDGLDRRAFQARFGHDALAEPSRARAWDELVALGLVHADADWLRPTPRGLWFADEIALRLS